MQPKDDLVEGTVKKGGVNTRPTIPPPPPPKGQGSPKPFYVDRFGVYHCPCGETHERGPMNGLNVYRCLKCGEVHTAYQHKPESILTPLLLEDALKWIRQRCWTVAVHNDYHLKGMLHTFWLFTKGNACIKGEGRTDLEALEQVMAQIREGIKCEVAGEEESRNAP